MVLPDQTSTINAPTSITNQSASRGTVRQSAFVLEDTFSATAYSPDSVASQPDTPAQSSSSAVPNSTWNVQLQASGFVQSNSFQAEVKTREYAGFWKRFIAAFIDGIILQISGLVILLIDYVLGSTDAIDLFLSLILGWLYFALMESSRQQATLGKQALGIIITDLNGNRISFGKATTRYFGKFISALILCIGFIMAGFTEKKQALHDIIAGCLVVKK